MSDRGIADFTIPTIRTKPPTDLRAGGSRCGSSECDPPEATHPTQLQRVDIQVAQELMAVLDPGHRQCPPEYLVGNVAREAPDTAHPRKCAKLGFTRQRSHELGPQQACEDMTAGDGYKLNKLELSTDIEAMIRGALVDTDHLTSEACGGHPPSAVGP